MITIKQFEELSEIQRGKLISWCRENDLKRMNSPQIDPNEHTIFWNDDRPLLNIGQMIEFLDEHGAFSAIGPGDADWCVGRLMGGEGANGGFGYISGFGRPELCDALWAACRDVLENDATNVRTDEQTEGGTNE